MNRTKFFPWVRATLFRGYLTQSQVDGFNQLLDAYDLAYPKSDNRWLAYMLATTFHETDQKMIPLEEYGRGRGLAYGIAVNGQIYFGRGYVQLTWLANYKAMSPVAGVDLVANPEKALIPSIAAKIMFYGMEHGTFTGHKLSDYLTPAKTDFYNCRRIINGTDKASLIASYAQDFLKAVAL